MPVRIRGCAYLYNTHKKKHSNTLLPVCMYECGFERCVYVLDVCLFVCASVFNSYALCAHLQHVKKQCINRMAMERKAKYYRSGDSDRSHARLYVLVEDDDSHINSLLDANVLVEFLVFFFSFHSFSRSLGRRRCRCHHRRRFVFLYVFLATIPFKANHDRINI